MKPQPILIVAIFALFFTTPQASAIVIYNDGGVHTINSNIPDSVKALDSPIGAGYTTVNLVSGGSIEGAIFAWENSRLWMSGGSIGYYLEAGHNSIVNISGGSIARTLFAWDYSQISISAGSIGREILALCSSNVTISGGSLGAYLHAREWSTITIYGSEFKINDIPIDYGPITVNSGHLIGTLASGEIISNDFYIEHPASIILVPEPATIAFLIFGVFLITKLPHQIPPDNRK